MVSLAPTGFCADCASIMIQGIASHLPAQTLDNEELVRALGRWTAEEVFQKTGIRRRRIAAPGETALDLAARAVTALFSPAAPSADFLLFCTQTADYKLPSSACLLQSRAVLPASCGALDLNLACSGFIYGLAVGEGLLRSGAATRVVLVNSDTYTRLIHPQDAVCRPIFGDGAAATLLGNETGGRILGFEFGTDGAQAMSMHLPAGGAKSPGYRTDAAALLPGDPEFIHMDGPEIYNFTLRVVPPAVETVLRKNRLTKDDIHYYVFHQANAFMLESLRRKLDLPREKFIIDLAETGNLVSASIPVVLERMQREGRIKPGCRVLLCGFGVGLSWASCIVEW